MRVLGIILITFVFVYVTSVHYKKSIYNERSYIDNLNQIQNKYTADVQKLRERLQRVRREISESGDMANRIAIYQEGLADYRDILSKVQSYITIPFDNKLCECENFTQLHKSTIMRSIQNSETALRKFKQDVSQRQNCSNINELNREIIKEEQYMGVIKDIINSDCKRLPRPFIEDRPLGLVNLKEYLLISNLESSKWIYGSLTESEYKYRMFALASKNNLTKCPNDKPFALNNKECVACTDDHPIWDLGSLQCTSCIPPQKYNPFGHNCTTKDITESDSVKLYRYISINSNPEAQNYIGRPPEINPVVPTCSKQTPFSDGSKCIRCNLPRVFNYNSLHCEFCPEGQNFDRNQKICMIGGVSQYGFSSKSYISSSTEEGEYLTNLNARNLLIPDGANFEAIVQQQRQLRDSKGNSIPLCSPDRPYFNGRRCIACFGDTPLFDLNRKECTSCITGYTYFSNVHKCTRNIRVTNAQAPNILQTPSFRLGRLYQTIEEIRNNNPNNKIQNCPIQHPFQRNNQCIECGGRFPLYNLQSKQCQRCSEGQYYDPNDKTCHKYSRITSPKSPNLYFKGTTKQLYEQQYKQAKESDPTILDCPSDAPYFNGKTCITCDNQNPIFSVYVKLCGKCPIGRIYDSSSGECKSTQPQTPTVPGYPTVPPATIPVQPPSDNKGGAVFSLF